MYQDKYLIIHVLSWLSIPYLFNGLSFDRDLGPIFTFSVSFCYCTWTWVQVLPNRDRAVLSLPIFLKHCFVIKSKNDYLNSRRQSIQLMYIKLTSNRKSWCFISFSHSQTVSSYFVLVRSFLDRISGLHIYPNFSSCLPHHSNFIGSFYPIQIVCCFFKNNIFQMIRFLNRHVWTCNQTCFTIQ